MDRSESTTDRCVKVTVPVLTIAISCSIKSPGLVPFSTSPSSSAVVISNVSPDDRRRVVEAKAVALVKAPKGGLAVILAKCEGDAGKGVRSAIELAKCRVAERARQPLTRPKKLQCGPTPGRRQVKTSCAADGKPCHNISAPGC